MRSKNLRRLLIILVLLALSPVLYMEGLSLYTYLRFALMPSATEQLLDFVEAPPGTVLPAKDLQIPVEFRGDAYNTDYQPVKDILARRFPVGTSSEEIRQFADVDNCWTGTDSITCSFGGTWYSTTSPVVFSPLGVMVSCPDTVYLTFSFDASNRLEGIEIIGATNCL